MEQTYTVNVPVSQTGKHTVRVLAGKKPVGVDWDKAIIYRLDGSRLSLDDAKQELGKLRTVFVVDDLNHQLEPADAWVQQIIKPETLIIATDALRSIAAKPLFPARALDDLLSTEFGVGQGMP